MIVSPSDPTVIIAGIRQFGLAPDGSDLRDLAAELARLERERDAFEAALASENNAISEYLRYCASHYEPSSDGRNTFIMAAEWVEARAGLEAKP